MKITDVRIRLMQREESNLKAIASITIEDCFVVHDIKVLEKRQSGDLYIKMPQRQIADREFTDIAHPINTETREEIIKLVLGKYEEELAKSKADAE